MTRVIDHLKELGLSAGEARRALESGKVSIWGVPTADAAAEVPREALRYAPRAPRLTPGRDLVILHHDEDLAVVWKPAGMLSIAAPGRGDDDNLISAVARILGRAHPVHRLDEGTSGLMLVAMNPEARARLIEALSARAIARRYLALVRGQPPMTPLRVETRFVRDRGDGLRGSVERNPELADDPRLSKQEQQLAATTICGVERLPGGLALVEARLETGRTHQVRVHLAERGLPVLGDPLYGGRSAARAFPRLALHAAGLTFNHPGHGGELRFEAPLPDDMALFRRRVLQGIDPRASTPRSKGRRR